MPSLRLSQQVKKTEMATIFRRGDVWVWVLEFNFLSSYTLHCGSERFLWRTHQRARQVQMQETL